MSNIIIANWFLHMTVCRHTSISYMIIVFIMLTQYLWKEPVRRNDTTLMMNVIVKVANICLIRCDQGYTGYNYTIELDRHI